MTGAGETDRPMVGVVIVNYGSHELVERNVLGLEFGLVRTSIIIVDNFSSANESRMIGAVCQARGWTLVRNDRNAGFGSAVNTGVARAMELGCSVFLLLNPDATLSQAAVAGLYKRVIEEPLSLVSPQILRSDGSLWFDGGTVLVDRGTTSTAMGSDSSAEHGWLSGACLMVHKELWLRLGGFNDEYFLYWEDVDLSWRCAKVGGRLVLAREYTAVHSVGGTQRGDGKSPRYIYFNCRNRMIFAAHHLSKREIRSWVRSSGRYALAVLLRGGRRQIVKHPLTLVGAAVAGTGAGIIRALPRSGGTGLVGPAADGG